jgi:peptide-methionine (S)-S-oxide reductase
MNFFTRSTPEMPPIEKALPGREAAIEPGDRHFVNGNPIKGPWPPGFEIAVFGNGCFWGTEEDFWQLDGVFSTAVGYVGGYPATQKRRSSFSIRTGSAMNRC